jgi:hypothetical protein
MVHPDERLYYGKICPIPQKLALGELSTKSIERKT